MSTTATDPLSTALARINSGEFEYEYKGHDKLLRDMTAAEKRVALANMDEMRQKDVAQRKQVRTMLASLYEVSEHKNEPLLWDMAWDQGHANGYSEVAMCYDNLVRLMR